MKILLINPPYHRLVGFKSEWFPLGLAYLASWASANGFMNIKIYDAEHGKETKYLSLKKYSNNLSDYLNASNNTKQEHPVWDEIKRIIIDNEPEIIGLTVITPKFHSAMKIADIAKKVNPKIIIICGGVHPTAKPEEVLISKDVDFVIRGEGEETFAELLKMLETQSSNYTLIDGLSYKDGNRIIHNKNRNFIKDIDTIPTPSRECLLAFDTFSSDQLGFLMTSRGCPYSCGFCDSISIWQRRVRWRSLSNVLNEIVELKTKYGVSNITFMDDSFTLDSERVEQFCLALIKNKINITWNCLTRVNMISDDIISLMKKAGCSKVDVGIESGNERILNLIDKKITLEEVRKAVNILRKNRMFWSGFFMFGFPSETEEEVFDTLNFLKELKPDWANISIFTPYPGTKLFDLAVKSGMISEPIDYSIYSHQNINRFTDKIPREQFIRLANYVLREIHKYNSKPKILLKRMFTRNYPKNPKLLFYDMKKVLQWISV